MTPTNHRFSVHTNLTETLVAEARRCGMPEDDDCVLDYVEPDNFAIVTHHTAFVGAVADAKAKIGGDFFGAPRIYREEWDEERELWQEIAFWEVSDEDEAVVLEEPTHVYDWSDD